MTALVVGACLVAAVPAALRWLRVAQREHYLPTVSRFGWRWWTAGWVNVLLALGALAGAVAAWWVPIAALVVPMAQIGPVGLGVAGRTARLAWTWRLRRLTGVVGVSFVGLGALGLTLDRAVVPALALLFMPVLVDLALVLTRPVEWVLASKWVRKAERKLAAVGPRVVAITGSYGKTTTKGYAAHLAGGTLRTVASPASFNNRLGLARAINEGLAPGTELFIAEMGTYGKGEIAEICSWVRPEVAAIVSIGPVHLERFGTEERIVAAKSEILEDAEVGVISIDHPLLAQLAADRATSMEVIEVSTGDTGRVRVTDERLIVDDAEVGEVPAHVFASNLAVAVGICIAVGVPVTEVARRLGDLPVPEHRQTVSTGATGFAIIDDTFNSNPAGARRALRLLEGMGGTKAVVTPGMVEMGRSQAAENEAFAAEASRVADHLVVVGRTNRPALLRGAAKGSASVTVVATREQAVTWARSNLRPGDAVLYENDLPDHYP